MSGPAESAAMDELLAGPAFGLAPERKRALLAEAVFDEMKYHFECNPKFRHFLDQNGWNPAGGPRPVEDLPFLHADVFKRLGSVNGRGRGGRAHTAVERDVGRPEPRGFGSRNDAAAGPRPGLGAEGRAG